MRSKIHGFTLIEIVMVLFILGLLASVCFPVMGGFYERTVLLNTAMDIKSALHFAQQLSIDESREYRLELFDNRYRIRENIHGGRVVEVQYMDSRIKKDSGSQGSVSYNRDGITPYRKFILRSSTNKKIDIEVLLGTGRVRISQIY